MKMYKRHTLTHSHARQIGEKKKSGKHIMNLTKCERQKDRDTRTNNNILYWLCE